MDLADDSYLAHYGILRKSGRYPWGSGSTQNVRNKTFLDIVDQHHKDGLSETQIADGFGLTTTQLRAAKSIAKTQQKASLISQAQRLKDKGYSNTAIGERLNMNESSVRALLTPGAKDRADVLQATANMLREQVNSKGLIDIGTGVETSLSIGDNPNAKIGISATKLATAVAVLKEEGYVVHRVKIPQLGTNHQTEHKVLAPPGTTWGDVNRNRSNIKQISDFSEDGGRTYTRIQPPKSISLDRVAVRYAADGGADHDGVIYVRRGVDDVSLGKSNYAQVRIAVNNTHYLKGMAMYHDDLPAGVDLVFNTNKNSTGNKLDAMKPLKTNKDGSLDEDSPFGTIINRQHGVMNVLNEEGKWGTWSRSLSSQMLGKQSSKLAQQQLDTAYDRKKREFDEINALTNPSVRKRLLDALGEDADSAAVHLKAAALPRQANQVILPIDSLKDNEVYAPNFRHGEKVVLVRHPHGGIFEIPELTVNNKHPESKKILGQAQDAIGINSRVAGRLSGADFDGDTVLVIPNNHGHVKNDPPLEGLKGFDPVREYPPYHGMKTMDGGVWNGETKKTEYPPGKSPSSRTKQLQMGLVSNLITDMTIRGASKTELARAVRHSMVVIDAEKHNLNYKESAVVNGIAQLKAKYQGNSQGGAKTLLSRASSTQRVLDRKPRSAAKGGPVDRATGEKVFENTGATKTTRSGKIIPKEIESTKLAEVKDAHLLSSGTPIEKVYADHSNRLKALANEARKLSVHTKPIPYSPSAKTTYRNEVASLNSKLALALRNRPLERQAQIIANSIYAQKKASNPDMEVSEQKKVKSQALIEARIRTGAEKQNILITKDEWAAIQAGAISANKLNQILAKADLNLVKELATPRTRLLMDAGTTARARSMVSNGYTQAEIADALGVSLTTLKEGLA